MPKVNGVQGIQRPSSKNSNARRLMILFKDISLYAMLKLCTVSQATKNVKQIEACWGS